jgi:uncharacterized protein
MVHTASSQNGSVGAVRLLLRASAAVNLSDSEGTCALMYASRNGHLAVAATLLDGSADVNQCKPTGMSSLIFAAKNGYLEVVRLLLERGADVHAVNSKQDGKQDNALNIAQEGGHRDVVGLLETYM